MIQQFDIQVCEERISDLSNRLAQQEEKVSQLKQERHELYQKLTVASDSARNQVRCKHILLAMCKARCNVAAVDCGTNCVVVQEYLISTCCCYNRQLLL